MYQFCRLTDVFVSFYTTDVEEGRTSEDPVGEVASGNNT